jgi:hypothetical protein
MKKGDQVLDIDGNLRVVTQVISFDMVYLNGDLSKAPAIPTRIETVTPLTKEVADVFIKSNQKE